MSTFNGNEGTFITLTVGGTMTAAFRKASGMKIQGFFFGANNLNSIINQTGCMGIRIYFGMDTVGNVQLVLVGADANTNDQTSGYVLDMGIACPPTCGTANALNS